MKYVTACPVCQHTDFSEFLACRDYTVSHETFRLQRCNKCGFLLTNPRPDDAGLGKYYVSKDYVSHSEDGQGVVDRIYRIARSFTLRWKYAIIHQHSIISPASVLDFGCGTGSFLKHCISRTMTGAGVEPATNARIIAEKNTGTRVFSSLEEVPGTYDVVTLWHVLEHISDLPGTLEKLKNSLEKNGTMFIAVPNVNSRDAGKYREHWAAYDVPRHLWHFSKTTMTQLLHKHAMTVINVLPMRLDAYYVSLLSEKYMTGKNGAFTMAKAFVEGLKSNMAAKRTQEYSSLIYIVRK